MTKRKATVGVEIVLDHAGWRTAVRGIEAWCRKAARAAVAEVRPKHGQSEFCLALSSDRRLRTLNRIFRGIDKPTNVLAFATDENGTPKKAGAGAQHLGDVVIALETARREAQRDMKTVRAHLAHLVVHGVLHLYGHDHMNDADAERMEGLERTALARLGIADPYRARRLRPKARRTRTARKKPPR